MLSEERATDVFDDLGAEHRQLDAVLAALEPEAWSQPSAASGWTISDVILHLAQSDELVVASVAGDTKVFAREDGVPLDELMDRAVAAEREASGPEVHQRWRQASAAALKALRGCAPTRRLAWAAVPLSARTLATTRLAEHWAHALDITGPLGIEYPDTARLRHIAWLGHRTLPYAFAVAGQEAGPVRCELTTPDGTTWSFGDPEAPSVIRGPAADFCRVGAQRLSPEDSALATEGPHAAAALRVIRNYAA